VVAASWLQENLDDPNLIIVDVRTAALYESSHMPGSLSIPFAYDSLWSRLVEGETLTMPPEDELFPDLSAHGFTTEKNVVIVTSTAQVPRSIVEGTRVAATLQYAGLATNKVGLLDGGFEGWIRAGGDTSIDPVEPTPASFTGPIDESVVVERAYVHASLNRLDEGIALVDARPTTAFTGGHIESALSIPLVNIWNADGTFKPASELLALFEAAVGDAPVSATEGEVIVYCFIGLMATSWHFVLTNVLNFKNVRLYDGSVEDWTKEYPLVTG
jgi:thiosulfate/3-mercaptopyruvate sulfurtransferase